MVQGDFYTYSTRKFAILGSGADAGKCCHSIAAYFILAASHPCADHKDEISVHTHRGGWVMGS